MSENTADRTSDIFVANESAVLFVDGEQYTVHKGQTRVRAGHPLLKRNAHFFEPIDVHYDVETAQDRPEPDQRPRRRTAKKTAASGEKGQGE